MQARYSGNMHLTRQNLSTKPERKLDSRSAHQNLAQNHVLVNENSRLAKHPRKAHQQPRPKRTLSFIPSLRPQNYAALSQVMQGDEQLKFILDALSPDVLLDFTNREAMLDFFPILFALIAMVNDHNQRNPHNHFAIIDMSHNKTLKKNLDGQLFFKKDDCKKFLCFVELGHHFTVLYFDVSSKKVLYADSLHSFDFEEEKIRKIAKMIKMPRCDILNLEKSRIEHQQKTNSCGIHTIANSFMFLKYGTKIPLIHVKAYKIRDQVGTFLWNCFEKYRNINIMEEDIFGSERERSEYDIDFSPESSDENDSEEEFDPAREERTSFEDKIMQLVYPAVENDFTDSEAVSNVSSRAASSSISPVPKNTDRRKRVPITRTVEPEIITISDDELPKQHPKNRSSKKKGNRTIEVVTLSDDETSSSEISDDSDVNTIQFVKMNINSKPVIPTKLDNENAPRNGSNTTQLPISTHFLSNTCFGIAAGSESLRAKDTQMSNNSKATDETFVTESFRKMVLNQNTIDRHKHAVSRQNQRTEELSIDDIIEPEKNSVAPTAVLPEIIHHSDVLEIIDTLNHLNTNETDDSGAVGQVDQVLGLEINVPLKHMDLDQENDNESSVKSQGMINIKSTSEKVEKNASPAASGDSQTDKDSNDKIDKNSSQNDRDTDVLEQRNDSSNPDSSSVISPPQTRSTETVHSPVHRPEKNNLRQPNNPHPNAHIHKVGPQAPTRHSKRIQQAPKRPHNSGPPTSSDLPTSSPKKTKTTWGLYTKEDKNEERMTRQKTNALQNEKSLKNPPESKIVPRLDQSRAKSKNDSRRIKNSVNQKDLKKAVLAAVRSREIMWKNAKGYKHYKVWEGIRRQVLATIKRNEKVKTLRNILENAKRVLRRKISELVSKDVKPEDMEEHLKDLKGYEDCKFLRESIHEQKRESRLRNEKKLKDQQKLGNKVEKNKKKPGKK